MSGTSNRSIPRVMSLAEWDRGVGRRRPDVLDSDPEGTVARARGLHLRILGADPTDTTGYVARSRQIALIVSREAERRRVARDAAETDAKWDEIRRERAWPGKDVLTTIWYGLPFSGDRDILFPELDHEQELTRGEWFEWVWLHKTAGEKSMIDHTASMIPPEPGETYIEWRARLTRRRRRWSEETNEVVVNRALYPQPRAGPGAVPRPSHSGKRGGRIHSPPQRVGAKK